MADFNLPDEGPMFLADETLHEAYELEIQSEKGDNVRFGELVAGKGDSVTTIVIFSEFVHRESLLPLDIGCTD
jgi:hypothetical protein